MSGEKIKKILIVDDDPVQVKLMEETLKKKGYEVKSTTEAATGLETAISQWPDLVILDVMMPVINGFNFCKLLKDQEGQNHIRIILVTSRDRKEDIEIGLEMGADAYLTKPVNIDELFRTIGVVENMVQKK